MKKLTSTLLILLLIASMTFSVFADGDGETRWEQNVTDNVLFDISYTASKPTIDGSVSSGEYTQIDLSDTEKYFNYYYGAQLEKTNPNILNDLKSYTKNDMKAYSAWDADYIYFALQAKAPKSEYVCHPSMDALVFRYWCLQVSVTDVDAPGQTRTEIGIGVDENDPEKYYFASWGTRRELKLEANKDFSIIWDRDNELITYELRIKFQDTLEDAPANGGNLKMCFCLCMSDGNETSAANTRQIQIGRGIAVQKDCKYFPIATLVNGPSVVTPGVSETEEDENDDVSDADDPNKDVLFGRDDFRYEENAAKWNITNDSMSVEHVFDGTDSFVRFTANSDDPYIGGNALVENINIDQAKAFAIRYRTSSDKAKRLGMKFTSTVSPDLEANPMVYPYYQLDTDGEWHTIVFEMDYYPEWSQFATSFYLYPFESAEDVAGETIDIEWIGYYADPFIVFSDNASSVPFEGVDTTAVAVTTPTQETKPAEETKSDETADVVTDGVATSGKVFSVSGVIIAVIAIPIIAAAVIVAIVIKKRK